MKSKMHNGVQVKRIKVGVGRSITIVVITLLSIFIAAAMSANVNAEPSEIDQLIVDVTTDKDKYCLGEPVNIMITVTNNGPDTILAFPTSCHADFFVNHQSGINVYHYLYDTMCLMLYWETTIEHGETFVLLNGTWNQGDDDGNPVPPGRYYIYGLMVGSLHLSSNPHSIELLVCSCIGDVNGDGVVNVLDMIRVGQCWNQHPNPRDPCYPADVNEDGVVNVLDMIVIGQHWGPCP